MLLGIKRRAEAKARRPLPDAAAHTRPPRPVHLHR
jgi:hypothetical protein